MRTIANLPNNMKVSFLPSEHKSRPTAAELAQNVTKTHWYQSR